MSPSGLLPVKRQKLKYPINPSNHASGTASQPIVTKPFPFLKLPAEIRNMVYKLLLTNTRNPNDLVLHGNDLYRRWIKRNGESRSRQGLFSKFATERSGSMEKGQCFVNSTPATTARLLAPVSGIPPLLEVGILLLCKQTCKEGLHVLYTNNNFAAILMNQFRDWKHIFGRINISHIRHLRIEVQLVDPGVHLVSPRLSEYNFLRLNEMRSLKTLHVIVTFRGHTRIRRASQANAVQHAAFFNRCWRNTKFYDSTMRALIAAIPKGIEVSWGLTKVQKEIGDYGGFTYAKGCVLRKIYSTYEYMRGSGVEDQHLDWRHVKHLPIDGDGHDSDEEK